LKAIPDQGEKACIPHENSHEHQILKWNYEPENTNWREKIDQQKTIEVDDCN